ncbi:MAG TPA: DUF933 domain-containing protein [Planctomycetaceae bacterium]|nr:DUF933 domain-containing protein [Planctomycetaceae bacterium]
MKIGLVGYQGGGKSSVFELLTGTKPDIAKAHTGQVGMATLPDARFDGLVKLFNPKKISPAKIELFDTPGLSRDKQSDNPQRLGVLRESDALVQVIGVYAGVDALQEATAFQDDLVLADLQIVNNRMDRLRTSIGKPRPDRDELKAELAGLEPLAAMLNEGKSLRDIEFTEIQDTATKSFSLLTRKKLLIVLNTADAKFDAAVVKKLEEQGNRVIPAPAGLELEVQALDEADRAMFAEEMGLGEPSKNRLLRAIFEVTDQIVFFTSDEKEVRAWLLKRGSTAIEAAGAIHTDLARGFIRAEVMAVDDLLRLGSEREVKAANLHHLVGKDHIIRDGDEIVVRFSV